MGRPVAAGSSAFCLGSLDRAFLRSRCDVPLGLWGPPCRHGLENTDRSDFHCLIRKDVAVSAGKGSLLFRHLHFPVGATKTLKIASASMEYASKCGAVGVRPRSRCAADAPRAIKSHPVVTRYNCCLSAENSDRVTLHSDHG